MGRIGFQRASRIGDRYRLVEKLGTGGMSVVWRGFDEILGRPVAVKVLAPKLAGDRAFRDRLRQEALAAARLCHPHITGIYDFGESPLATYVVMELIDGESVAARIGRDGPMECHAAVSVAAEVAAALAAAHAHGVVHRDVTPANVMLTAVGAKVVDFGISALVGQRDAAPDGSLLGTPAYLAPERLAGGEVTTATDVYALGLLLYRCLTARLPWPAGNTTEALRAHLYADPEPLPSLPGLPASVADLCLRCLAKDPAARPAAADVAAALTAVLPLPFRSAGLDPSRGAGPDRSLCSGGRERSAGGRPARETLRLVSGRQRAKAALATGALLAALGVGWSVSRQPQDAATAQAAAALGPVAAPVSRPDVRCKVRYQVRRDTGTAFVARLSVANISARGLTGWRLEYTYPGTQRLVAGSPAIVQRGRMVLVHGLPDATLAVGRFVTVTLRGTYRISNPLPLSFALDGYPCTAEVIGATTVTGDGRPDDGTARSVTRAAGTQRSGGGSASTGRRHDQSRTRLRTRPATPPRTARTPAVAPATPKIAGRAVAV